MAVGDPHPWDAHPRHPSSCGVGTGMGWPQVCGGPLGLGWSQGCGVWVCRAPPPPGALHPGLESPRKQMKQPDFPNYKSPLHHLSL